MCELSAVFSRLGIESLTPMQEEVLNKAPSYKDLVLLAPTGSGKTLAFLLPILRWLSESKDSSSEKSGKTPSVRCLILSPSRELALQTASVWRSLGSRFPAVCSYGGHLMVEERKVIEQQHPSLVIGTPGRVSDLIGKGYLDPSSLTLLVIDEFDKSLELGFCEVMEEIVLALPALDRKWLISATDNDDIPRFLSLGNAAEEGGLLRIDYRERALSERLKIWHVTSPQRDKLETLCALLGTLHKIPVMVFVNHREAVDRIVQYLSKKGVVCDAFHGGMDQNLRERALYRFRSGSSYLLVATDLAARGLDISEVGAVIHYHLPPQEDAFTHRNGRTARWTAEGMSFWISSEEEKVPAYLLRENHSEYQLPEDAGRVKPSIPDVVALYIGRGKKEKIGRGDIVGFLCKKGGLNAAEVGLIEIRDHHSYVAIPRRHLCQTLQLLRGEKIKGQRTLIEEAK